MRGAREALPMVAALHASERFPVIISMNGAILALCLSLPVSAQTFEAASVKPAAPRTGRGGRTTVSGDRVSYAYSTLANLVARAYSVKTYQIEGPSWIRTERFDVVAKGPDHTPLDQIPVMLQALLMERFQLKVHREQKEISAYWAGRQRAGEISEERRGIVVRHEQ